MRNRHARALTMTCAGLLISAAAWASGPYDGTYHGTLTQSAASGMNCAKKAPIQMTVVDNKLEYHHFGNAIITAQVAPDGSFSGSAENRYSQRGGGNVQTLTGKITATGIEAQTKVGNSCFYELKLKRFS